MKATSQNARSMPPRPTRTRARFTLSSSGAATEAGANCAPHNHEAGATASVERGPTNAQPPSRQAASDASTEAGAKDGTHNQQPPAPASVDRCPTKQRATSTASPSGTSDEAGASATTLHHAADALASFDPVAYAKLRVAAECFHDFQQVRIALANRMLVRTPKAPRGTPKVKRTKKTRLFTDPSFAPILAGVERLEDELGKTLVAQFRVTAPPGVRQLIKEQRGLGEHTLARFLGHLGHPRIATPYRWDATPPADHVCDPLRCGADRHLVAEPWFYRTEAQLRSFCGYGDPQRRRRKGMTAAQALACGSPTLKMLGRLVAEGCVKAGTNVPSTFNRRASRAGAGEAGGHQPGDGHHLPAVRPHRSDTHAGSIAPSTSIPEATPHGEASAQGSPVPQGASDARYRHLYDAAKTTYASRVHVEPCPQCGKRGKGKPALAGSPWKPGHQHGAALRLVVKAFLKDLYAAADAIIASLPKGGAHPRRPDGLGRPRTTRPSSAATAAESVGRS